MQESNYFVNIFIQVYHVLFNTGKCASLGASYMTRQHVKHFQTERKKKIIVLLRRVEKKNTGSNEDLGAQNSCPHKKQSQQLVHRKNNHGDRVRRKAFHWMGKTTVETARCVQKTHHEDYTEKT